jgi:hypothetical protein
MGAEAALPAWTGPWLPGQLFRMCCLLQLISVRLKLPADFQRISFTQNPVITASNCPRFMAADYISHVRMRKAL